MGTNLKIWMQQFRAPFLLLAIVLVLIGVAYAVKYPSAQGFNYTYAILLLIGVISAHSSVNLFNEYSDFHTKIDFNTKRNPFSGGSGMLTEGHTTPKAVLTAAITTLLIGLAIGIYFIFVSHPILIVFIALGAFATVFYTNFLAKIMLGEFFAGLTLGTFVVLGTYVAMTATPDMPWADTIPKEVWLISIAPGILTALLLFLNEFPDAQADKQGGRLHLVIKLGLKTSGYVYALGILATYAVIVILPLSGISSYWLLIALLTLPIALKATMTAIKSGDKFEQIVPAMGQNVLVVLITDLLIAVSVFIA
ncbi:prenyltransferase [Bacteroidetes/Chlorobi group bacterium ChocPot_Mid]|nr:MAG: prenyltransferase [Bacteroidetes/Chlorobi group bacterium ChocPot_Mid]